MEEKGTILLLFENFIDEIYETTDKSMEITKRIVEVEDELYKELTGNQRSQVEKMFNLESDRTNEVNKNIFIYAFSLANRLLIESLKENKKK